jgi:hypothetical protein
VQEADLVAAQLRAITDWQRARRERYDAALVALGDAATRVEAAHRLARLARQQTALLERADAPADLPAAAPPRPVLRTVLVGQEVLPLLPWRRGLGVVALEDDADAAVGVAVVEQPDAVVFGLDVPFRSLAEAVADLRRFVPQTTVGAYGACRRAGRRLTDSGLVHVLFTAGTDGEQVAAGLRDAAG